MDLKTAHARIAEDNVPADELYTTVVRRGRRQRRGRVLLRATGVAAALAVGGLAVAAVGDDPTATSTTAPDPSTTSTDVAQHETSTSVPPPEGVGPSGWVTLRAPDWRESVDADRASAAGLAPFVVRDADGTVVSEGNVGTYGEAILHHPVGTFTIEVPTLVDGRPCGFSATVTIETDGQQVPLELRCA